MSLHLTWRNGLLALIALALAGLLARALLRDDGGPLSARSVVLDTPQAPTTAATPLPSRDNHGSLVLIQGLKERRLVIAPLDGSTAPYAVDSHLATWPLLPDPTGARLIYSTEHTLMALDTVARRAAIVGTLPEDGQVTLAQWSPDGQAIAYVVATPQHHIAYYSLADGSTRAEEMLRVPHGLPLDVAWLADGRPVGIYLGIGPVGGLQAFYQLYEPATGDTLPLPADISVIQPWAPWRSPDGSQQVYATTAWEEARRKRTCRSGALGVAGADWLYLSAREGNRQHVTALAVDGLYMDRPTWLADGRILFRAIADEVCTSLSSGLYVGRPGEEPTLRVASMAQALPDGADRLLASISYALLEDDLAWSENDVLAQRSAVYAAPLAGGEPRILYETPRASGAGAPFSYRDSEIILYLVWLP